jgi:hypothetical protein
MTAKISETVSHIVDIPAPHADPYTPDARHRLVAFMRGAQIRIPDLEELTSHWPTAIHPEIERLEKELDKTLEW